MGRLSVNWVISKQREIEEYAKTITDLLTHGEIRSKKHKAVLQELFFQEQITIFRKQLPFYTQLLANWQNELNADLNHHVFFPRPNGQKWSVIGEQKITLLMDMITMLTDDEIPANEGFFQALRRKEIQLLALSSAEDALTAADTPVIFFPLLGKTYEELLQDYIEEVGLVYFQEEYSRVYKLLYYKIIRDLRGVLRAIIRTLFRNCDDEDADTNVFRNQDNKLIFKNFFIRLPWKGQKLSNISGVIWSPINYLRPHGTQWKRLAD
jgi:hypothetical protein